MVLLRVEKTGAGIWVVEQVAAERAHRRACVGTVDAGLQTPHDDQIVALVAAGDGVVRSVDEWRGCERQVDLRVPGGIGLGKAAGQDADDREGDLVGDEDAAEDVRIAGEVVAPVALGDDGGHSGSLRAVVERCQETAEQW